MAPGRQCKLHAPSPPLAAHGLLVLNDMFGVSLQMHLCCKYKPMTTAGGYSNRAVTFAMEE